MAAADQGVTVGERNHHQAEDSAIAGRPPDKSKKMQSTVFFWSGCVFLPRTAPRR